MVIWERGWCRLVAYGPADATAVPKPRHLLPLFKSRLVLPFWYWLTQVVQEKRPINGRSSTKHGLHVQQHWAS